jgi:hypothetical protein
MQSLNPVGHFIQIKRIPSKLIGEILEIRRIFPVTKLWIVLSIWFERVMGCRRYQPVEPRLQIFLSWGSKRRTGKLLRIET